MNLNISAYSIASYDLTFWRRKYFFNFSTPCIYNVNNKVSNTLEV